MDYNYATEYEQAMEQIRELESELAELQESLEDSQSRVSALEEDNKIFVEKLEEVQAFLEDEVIYGSNRLKEEIRRLD